MNNDYPLTAGQSIDTVDHSPGSASGKSKINDQCGLTDGELLEAVQAGQVRAFGVLYQRYLAEIYRFIYYRIANDQFESEDLTQEVFLRAWGVITTNRLGGKKEKNFRALLYRIAHNLVIDRWRKQRSVPPVEEDLNFSSIPDETALERGIIKEEEIDDLQQAVQNLSPQLQDVFICRFINDLSYVETAKILGLKVNHVRVLQHRALKEIRILI